MLTMPAKFDGQRGMTSVEYAIIAAVMIVTIIATVLWLVNPADIDNSLLPQTYTAVGNKVGNFGLVNLPEN